MAGDDQDGQWLNLTAAAHRLGWSRERLRSYVRRGNLRTMRGNSGELLVLVTTDLTGAATVKYDRPGRAVSDRPTPEAAQEAERWRILAEQRGQALARAEGELTALGRLVDEMRAALEREQARADRLEARLALPWWRRWLG